MSIEIPPKPRPRRRVPNGFQERTPVSMGPGEVAFAPALPQPGPVQTWRSGKVASLPIGWFDEELLQKILEASSEGSNSDGSTVSAPKAVSEADILIRRLAAALQPPLEALYAPNGVLDWPAPLLGYQREGITALLGRQELLLADDMGLGKTIQAIAAMRILAFQQLISTALVVCPASLLAQWRRELERWAPELHTVTLSGGPAERSGLWRVPAHVRLVSYETLRADVLDLQDSPVLRQSWDVMVLDEASRIKNRESTVAIACKRVPRDRRWALTGTPLENSIHDLESLLEFLKNDHGVNRVSFASADLKSQLKQVQLRRRKSDVLTDLPPKQIYELPIELTPAQREAYQKAEREGLLQLSEAGTSLSITHVLELISRLKQLCNVDPVTGESAKLADIAQRLRILVAEGHRALVFSQFTDDTFGVGRAARYLQEFHPLQYTGSLSTSQRTGILDRFQTDSRYKALLLSLRAGGVGLNLQSASYVFHLDRWWNPALEDQADSRSHRMGQPYPVTIFRYVCTNTIEERIDVLLKEKRKLFHEVVDDVSLELTGALTEQEIFGLFGLRSPRRTNLR